MVKAPSFFAIVVVVVVAVFMLGKPVMGQTTVAIQNGATWCMFMPPGPNEIIGQQESDAIAFCTPSAVPQASGSKPFPSNLITTSHFLQTASYVQVSGSLNPSAYFNPSDQGGQFDSDQSPTHGVCAGYSIFVNIIEPANNRYCIRCCNTRTTDPTVTNSCLFDHSQYGCVVVVPNGIYDKPTSSPVASTSSTTQLTTSNASTALSTASTTTTTVTTARFTSPIPASVASSSTSSHSSASPSSSKTTDAAASTISGSEHLSYPVLMAPLFCIATLAVILS